MPKRQRSGSAEVTMKVDASAVKAAAADLSDELADQAADALRQLGDEFVAQARRTVRSAPSRSNGGMRERIARGIDARVRDGKLDLTLDPSVPSDRRAFPLAFNLERWSHPTFGRRPRVTQRGRPYWRPKEYARRAEQLLTVAADRAAAKVNR